MSEKGISRIAAMFKEPLLHFILLGGLIALAYRLLGPDANSDAIVVDDLLRKAIIAEQSTVLRRPLSRIEEKHALETYLRKEVLFREAIALGLDRNDPILRERMVASMRSLLTDDLKDPTDEELTAFFEKYRDRYRRLEWVSFDQVFFPPESMYAIGRPDSVLLLMRSMPDPRTLGFHLPGGLLTQRIGRFDVQRLYGTAMLTAIESMESGNWQGPIGSRHGFHYIRITDRKFSEPLPFNDVRPILLKDYLSQRNELKLNKAIDSLLTKYRIVYLHPG
jgi:hypothetical protein